MSKLTYQFASVYFKLTILLLISIVLRTNVWYNITGYIWNISDAFPFYLSKDKRKVVIFMTKREFSQFIIILLLFLVVIILLLK